MMDAVTDYIHLCIMTLKVQMFKPKYLRKHISKTNLRKKLNTVDVLLSKSKSQILRFHQHNEFENVCRLNKANISGKKI